MKQPNIYHYSVQIGPLQLAILVVQNRRAGTQKSHWDKTNIGKYRLKLSAFCWSCPRANFVSQHGGFVPRVWQAAKGLYLSFNHCVSSPRAPQIACSVKYGRL